MTPTQKVETYLQTLCLDIPSRVVGSEGNRQATDFFADKVKTFGFETECPTFDCIDWTNNGANLTVGEAPFNVFSSPYTLAYHGTAPLKIVSTMKELEHVEAEGDILLVQGELAKEQLMPKNFVFYNPEHHKQIIHLLEKKNPAAIVAATSRDPGLAGGMYPFPLIEDGDFDIPSVYMKDVDGESLAKHEGESVSLEIRAERKPAKACNVFARKGAFSQGKVVYMAHIDTKPNTPGAIDNASGIIVLLLLAELLADYQGELGLEIIAINGEDYYAASGEMDYLRTQSDTFPQIMLAVNMDGAGYHKTDTAYSLYNPPEDVAQAVRQTFASRQGMVEGDPWYQSDHSMFIQNQVPALAITSQFFMQEAALDITHSPKDRPSIVEPSKLTEIASALDDLHLRLNKLTSKT